MSPVEKLFAAYLHERIRNLGLADRVDELEQDVADLQGELAADQAAHIDGVQVRREVLEA